MDDLGPIELEFLINNPELTAAAAQAETTLQNVATTAQIQAAKAIESITAATNGSIGSLKLQAAQLQALKELTPDPAKIAIYTQKIQELEVEITRLANIGKAGFDEMGIAIAKVVPVVQQVAPAVEQITPAVGKFQAAISRVTDVQNIGARVVTQFTRQIIGLGVGFLSLEIGAKAIQGLIEWVSNLDIFTGRLDAAVQKMKAFNEVNLAADKSAAPALTSLKLLYDAATNVNNSMQKRLEAAEQLRESYAAEFANASNLAIINGKLKASYDDLSASIIANAKSQAAQTKISDLGAQILDAQFQIDKNNSKKSQRIAQANNQNDSDVKAGDPNAAGILAQRIAQITSSTNANNLAPTQTIKSLQGKIDYLSNFIKSVSKKSDDLKNANKLLGDNLQNYDNLINNVGSKTDLDNIQNALQTKLNQLGLSDSQMSVIRTKLQEVDDLEKEYQVKATSTKTKVDPAKAQGQSLLASQTSELEKISALKDKYAAKDETRDEQAQDAIKAAFTLQLNAINALNVKYDNYVAKFGAAAAKAAGLQRIDPSVLNDTETDALAGLAGTQSLEQTKNQINQQKVIFTEYEAFKLKAGTDAANALYGNELKGFTNYVAYLKSLQPTEADLTSADPYVKAAASSLSDYLKTAIPAAQDAVIKANLVALQSVIENTKTAASERESIETKYQADVLKIAYEYQGDDYVARLNLLDAYKQKALDSATELAFAQSQIGLEAAKNLTVLSSQQLTDFINKLKADLNSATNLTPAQRNKIQAAIKQAEGLLGQDQFGQNVTSTQTSDEFTKIAAFGTQASSTFSQLATDLQGVNSGLSDAAKGISEFAKLASTAATAVAQFSAGNIVGGVASSLSFIGTIISLFDHSKEEAEQLAYATQLQVKAIGAVNTELERQLALTKQVYGPQRIADYLTQLKSIQAAIAQDNQQLAGKLSLTGDKAIDDLITKVNSGQKLSGNLQQIIDKVKLLGLSVDLSTQSIAQLQTLLDNGKLDAATSAIVQSLIDLQQQAIDTQNALTQDLTGTSFDDLENSIVSLFQNVTTSAQDFSNNFQKIIQTGILNAFKRDFLDSQLQKFYDDFDKLTQNAPNNVLTAAQIAQLQQEYNTIIAQAQQGFQNIQQVTGQTFTNPSSASPTTLSGQIQGITADQANLLEGAINGLRLTNLLTNDLLTVQGKTMGDMSNEMRSQTLLQMQIAANTLRSADNSDIMVGSLKSIASNTSATNLTNAVRAAGKI